MSSVWDDFPPGQKEHWRKRAVWEESLDQETYNVAQAAGVMKMGERRVRKLLTSGDLYHEKKGERGVVIPKEAIIAYMVGPSPMERLSGNAEKKRL